MVTAAYATTMHFLTGGRFALGLGRGIDMMFDAFGLPHITTAQMEDFAELMRRLWHGETVVDHEGPAGKWPVLRLDPAFREDIPLMLTAFGPKSLSLGGRAFDGVVLHTFFTDETTTRCVRTIKQAAEEAGRDPARGARLVVFRDDRRSSAVSGAPEENRWADGDVSAGIRRPDGANERLGSGSAETLPREQAGRELPGRHRPARDHGGTRTGRGVDSGRVAGAGRRAARRNSASRSINGQFELGCDGVILHGASPTDLAPIVEAYRAQRPSGRFDHLPANPAAVGGRQAG